MHCHRNADAFTQQFNLVTTRLQQASALVGLGTLAEAAAAQVRDLLATKVSAPVEFVFGQGATIGNDNDPMAHMWEVA